MTTIIEPNTSVVISASFFGINTETNVEEPLVLQSISGEVQKWNGTNFVFYAPFVPVEVSPGIYTHLWIPTSVGKYKLTITGEIQLGEDVVNTRILYVGDIETTKKLGSPSIHTFLTELDPLFLDPETILIYYPEADLVEVTELIYWYSKEVLYVKNVAVLTEITPTIRDFILASVLCELSRIYVFDGGLAGFTSADSFSLADLSVSKSTGASRSKLGNEYSRSGPTTWCEMAALLREQLIAFESNLKSVVKSINQINPIPNRQLRRFE